MKARMGFKIAGVLIAVFVFVLVLELMGVGMFRIVAPLKEDARREVFENTQSYTHGKIQDLAKYYREYGVADDSGKESIKSIVLMQFAEFDESKIKSDDLRNFLTEARGY